VLDVKFMMYLQVSMRNLNIGRCKYVLQRNLIVNTKSKFMLRVSNEITSYFQLPTYESFQYLSRSL